MEAQALALIMSFFGLLILTTIYFTTRNYRKSAEYKLEYTDEKARALFADARRTLFQHSISGKIDSNDELFKSLYSVSSDLMRLKGDYDVLGKRLLNAMINRNFTKTKIKESSRIKPEEIPEEYLEVLEKMVKAYSYIVVKYSSIPKFTLKLLLAFSHSSSSERVKNISDNKKSMENSLSKMETIFGGNNNHGNIGLC